AHPSAARARRGVPRRDDRRRVGVRRDVRRQGSRRPRPHHASAHGDPDHPERHERAAVGAAVGRPAVRHRELRPRRQDHRPVAERENPDAHPSRGGGTGRSLPPEPRTGRHDHREDEDAQGL
ncbi:MAG: hypothetical protein AVDCRST_MAG53-690, partial [uncultured Solirubrobacteraceae bacterium]